MPSRLALCGLLTLALVGRAAAQAPEEPDYSAVPSDEAAPAPPPPAAPSAPVTGGATTAAAPFTVASGTGTAYPGSVGYAPQAARPRLGVSLGLTIVGGVMVIAGAATLGTTERYYSTSDCVRAGDCTTQPAWYGLVTVTAAGAAITAIALPFLILRARRRRQWDREHEGASGRLIVEPELAYMGRSSRWGLRLGTRF